MQKLCEVEGCDRIAVAKQLCATHYERMRKHGDVRAHIPIRKPVRERFFICAVEGCADLARSDGLCGPHALRLRREGDVRADDPVHKKTPSRCTVADCDLPAICRGVCPPHYYRLTTWGDTRPDIPLRKTARRNLDGAQCSVEGCVNVAHSNDLCEWHFTQQRYLWTRYRMTASQYQSLLAEQDYRCAICRTDDSGMRNGTWNVDHDHSCCPEKRSCGNCVRGLLCANCNNALGSFRDDLAIMAAAMTYISAHSVPRLRLLAGAA